MALNEAQRQAIAAIDGPPADEPKQTQEAAAQSAGAPKSEASQMSEAPFIEVDMGNGQVRKMTAQQIKGMSERYSSLNYRNAQLKPVTEVIEGYLQANPGMTPDQLAGHLKALAASQQDTIGNGRKNRAEDEGRPGSSRGRRDADGDDDQSMPGENEFSRWENDNATTLPPGYKQMHSAMSQMQQMMAQQQMMMQQLLGATAGQVDAARQAHVGAMQQQSQSIQATIGNNLDRAQQAMGLPDSAAQDFMMFAQERGYNFEDFVDPQLTVMVMNDFRNAMQSPEMDRLRQIHQRRTAYTPGGGSAPMGGGGQQDPQAADFQDFSSRIISQKR